MSRNSVRTLFVCAALAGLAASAAYAHVTLETRQAPAESYYKAVIKVPHGCSGSPTVRLRVQIPDGVVGVKPQPKPGWQVAITRAKLDPPLRDSHGNAVNEVVREVAWSGGRLLDEHYDEFLISLRLPNAPGRTLYFPTIQECEQGVHRWIELPEGNRTPADYREPAPSVTLGPK